MHCSSTEARRVTVLEKHRRIYDYLEQLAEHPGDRDAARFPQYRERIERRRAMLDRVGHEQIALLRLVRDTAADPDQRSASVSALLFSINCIAAGFGTTG